MLTAAASLTLTDDEVRELSGGYVRAADQLKALLARGYFRAYRSKVTGRVIVERAHYDAVAAGASSAANDARPRPKLRPAA